MLVTIGSKYIKLYFLLVINYTNHHTIIFSYMIVTHDGSGDDDVDMIIVFTRIPSHL